MRIPTTAWVLKKWLRNRLDNGLDTVASHEIETTLVHYAKEFWGVQHSPSTWSRAWRKIKEKNELEDIDVVKVEIINNKSAETTWKLKTGM
jgi:hypothetical protein|tara:strand:+ start:166 stop:438 length:273 start_codon:yes stop_codon:yes gene_type:complete